MILKDRTYSPQIHRPKPIIRSEKELGLLSIAFVWGDSAIGDKVIDEIFKYYSSSVADMEITSPFEMYPHLTREANFLRIGTLLANDLIYRTHNKTEYLSGVEILTIYKKNQQISWAQVGMPGLFIHNKKSESIFICTPKEHSTEFSDGDLPPLPSHLLGVEKTCGFQVGDFHLNDSDKIFVGAFELSQLPFNIGDFDTISQSMIRQNPQKPFWLAEIENEN